MSPLHDDWSQNQVQACDQSVFHPKSVTFYFILLHWNIHWTNQNQSIIQTNYNTERLSKSMLQIVWPALSICVCTHNAISKSIDHQIANKSHPDHRRPKSPCCYGCIHGTSKNVHVHGFLFRKRANLKLEIRKIRCWSSVQSI